MSMTDDTPIRNTLFHSKFLVTYYTFEKRPRLNIYGWRRRCHWFRTPKSLSTRRQLEGGDGRLCPSVLTLYISVDLTPNPYFFVSEPPTYVQRQEDNRCTFLRFIPKNF